MKKQKWVLACSGLLAVLLAVCVGGQPTDARLLSDTDLASLWGGSAQGCEDGDPCCKCGNKSCTDIDCEYAPTNNGWKYCEGTTAGVSVHDCWVSSDLDDSCNRISPTLSNCYGNCWNSSGSCTGSAPFPTAQRYKSNCT